MAKIGFNLFLLVSLVAIAITASQVKAQVGGDVGGRSEVQNVKRNMEVQELGKYCVAEYNKGLKEKKQGNEKLKFKEVIKAEKQVVAGLKYYLRISATGPGGATKTFDSEVVVKPRDVDRELVTFAPSKLSK